MNNCLNKKKTTTTKSQRKDNKTTQNKTNLQHCKFPMTYVQQRDQKPHQKCGCFQAHLQVCRMLRARFVQSVFVVSEMLVALKSQNMPNHAKNRSHEIATTAGKMPLPNRKGDMAKWWIPQVPRCNMPYGQKKQKNRGDAYILNPPPNFKTYISCLHNGKRHALHNSKD